MGEGKLRELIRKSAPTVREELLKSFSLIPYLKTSRELLKREERAITDFLEGKREKGETVGEIIKGNLPYPVIQKFVEGLKVKILERIVIENEVEQEEVELLKERFSELEREIAREYLKRDVKELRDVKNSKFKKYALYRAHAEYIEKIIEAVEGEELSKFPLENYAKSAFKKSIYYPESIMACMNAYFCDYLENLERAVFRAAKAFFVLLRKENYPEGYLAFKELKELALKVSQKLAELYFLAFTNGESNFIKLVEYLRELYPKRLIAALDFADLKSLNRALSESTVNRMLEKVERVVHEHFKSRVDKYLAVRGINHNFLILGVNVSEEEFEREMEELFSEVERALRRDGIVAQFRIYGFPLDRRFEGFESRLNNFLSRIKERAKKEGRKTLILKEEKEVEELLSWQREQFRKISFITQKVNGGDIEVVFQPIADSQTLDTVALETLFRLKDGNTLIPPGLFIDIIYQLNLITVIDRLVLEKILEQKELIASITDKLFINVSPQSLSTMSFLEELDRFIRQMEEFSIFLEITEQRLLENACELKNLSKKYRNLKFAIDDFGSGYSSFKLVIDLAENRTLEVLKLDGSYTKKVSTSHFTRKAIRAIASLSKSLGIKTVAEFVEEQEAAKILKEEGIDYLQGYFISKPKTIEEIIYQIEQINNL